MHTRLWLSNHSEIHRLETDVPNVAKFSPCFLPCGCITCMQRTVFLSKRCPFFCLSNGCIVTKRKSSVTISTPYERGTFLVFLFWVFTESFFVVQYGCQNSLPCDFNKIRWLLKIKIELKFRLKTI